MRTGRALAIAAVGLLTMSTTPTARSAPISVDEALDKMSLREKAGQLVMLGMSGTGLSATERDVIRDNHLGGVILFARNYRDASQLVSLTTQIQTAARHGNDVAAGALIAVDQEGGVVKRFPDMPPWKSAPEMGDVGRERVALEQGKATGRNLIGAGVNVDLAPVADLDLPPNHVMRSRSFGTRPRKVGNLVQAFGRGLQAKGVAATAKHFPGLGGGTQNTDNGRSVVDRSRRELEDQDEIPFRYAIGGDFRMIMVSHAIYPHYGGGRPASVNHLLATEVLREDLGFEGVAISDDLGALAWRFGGSIPDACVATIKAGVDIALTVSTPTLGAQCARAIRQAVLDGDIRERRLDNAVRRVLELKAWLGLCCRT